MKTLKAFLLICALCTSGTKAANYTPPVAKTLGAINVTATSVTLYATINPDGDSYRYKFEYDTDPRFVHPKYSDEGNTGLSYSDVYVEKTISGLNPNTTYHYRVARIGGPEGSFTTKKGGEDLQLYSPINIPGEMIKGQTYNYSVEVVNNSLNRPWTGRLVLREGSVSHGDWTKTINPGQYVTLQGSFTATYRGDNQYTLYYFHEGSSSAIYPVDGGNFSNPVSTTTKSQFTVTFDSNGGSTVACTVGRKSGKR